jgi:hypothetical protein
MMSMNLERAQMRGVLEEKKQQRERCRYAIKGNADAIRGKLNTLLTTPDELEVPLIDELWDQIKSTWSQLQLLNADIKRFEKELA